VRDGDTIEIDIPARKLNVKLSDAELAKRREEEKKKGRMAFKPAGRDRSISDALRAYAKFVTSADRGAIRIVPEED